MNFIISLFWVISFDSVSGFTLYLLWKYLDMKYFCSSEIEQLKLENEYLRKENKKFNGTSADFYGKDYEKL